MKISANREGLLTAFQVASGVVPSTTTRPILRQCRLDVAGETDAALLATDGELSLRYAVSGVVAKETGKAILPTAQLTQILRELPDQTVTLTVNGTQLRVAGSGARYDLPTEDPDVFPDVGEPTRAENLSIAAGRLVGMIRRTVFAAAKEHSRYALYSVQFAFDGDGSARMIGTDGHRLALMPAAAAATGPGDFGAWAALLPIKAANLLPRMLLDPEEAVAIYVGPSDATFQTSRFAFVTRLVEGRFPDHNLIINKDTSKEIPLSVAALAAAVRQAKIVTNAESRGVRFTFGDGQAELRSHGADTGEAEVSFPVAFDGEPFDVSYNPDFLLEMLRGLPSDGEVVLHVGDPKRASVFRFADGYVYVIMPMTK